MFLSILFVMRPQRDVTVADSSGRALVESPYSTGIGASSSSPRARRARAVVAPPAPAKESWYEGERLPSFQTNTFFHRGEQITLISNRRVNGAAVSNYLEKISEPEPDPEGKMAGRHAELQALAEKLEVGETIAAIREQFGPPSSESVSPRGDQTYFVYSPYPGRTILKHSDKFLLLKMTFDAEGRLLRWSSSAYPRTLPLMENVVVH